MPPVLVQLGLSFRSPSDAALPSVGRLATWCRELAVGLVELDAGVIEAWLGAPTPIVPLEPSVEDGLSVGLLELEEDVLRDAYELARATHAAQLRAWRASVALSPLAALRRQMHDEGVSLALLRWDDLARVADDEVEYAFRVAEALGARAVSTTFSGAGARRLVPVADRHDIRLGLSNDEATAGPEYLAAFGHGRLVSAAIDLGNWTAGGHGSPVDFLGRHANRISHVRVTDRRVGHGPPVRLGEGEAPIKDVLQAMRDRGWPFPALVAVHDPIPAGSSHAREAALGLEYCRRCLAG